VRFIRDASGDGIISAHRLLPILTVPRCTRLRIPEHRFDAKTRSAGDIIILISRGLGADWRPSGPGDRCCRLILGWTFRVVTILIMGGVVTHYTPR